MLPTFKQYVLTVPMTDDPAGDFMADARRDRDFTKADVATWRELLNYLQSSDRPNRGRLDPLVREAGHRVWLDYATLQRIP